MRQFQARWWSTPEMMERRPHRETVASTTRLTRQNIWELTWVWKDLADEFSDLCYIEFLNSDPYRSERCPRCGGWCTWSEWMKRWQRAFPTLWIQPMCRDCGWPEAEDFLGSNIVVPNPRTAFKLRGGAL